MKGISELIYEGREHGKEYTAPDGLLAPQCRVRQMLSMKVGNTRTGFT